MKVGSAELPPRTAASDRPCKQCSCALTVAATVPVEPLATGGTSLAPKRLAEATLMLGEVAEAVGAAMTNGAGVLLHALKVKSSWSI